MYTACITKEHIKFVMVSFGFLINIMGHYMQDSKRDTDVKNRLLDYVGKDKGGMVCENSIETCILPYVKQMTRASSMHKAGHSKLVLWDNPEGCAGKGGRFKMGRHMCTCG